MTTEQVREAHPLISNAGNVRTERAVWRVARLFLAPVSILCAAIAGAHSEHQHMLAAVQMWDDTQ